MAYNRILTIQDISCVGQCSITVALPILSACGMETAILPSAVLSTHTGGFTGYTVHDLTKEIPFIMDHWKQEQIYFDGIYTGYLGNIQQISYVRKIFTDLLKKEGKRIVDPAMADNGKLYPAFDMVYVAEMRKLAFSADVILPNITEAALLADVEYCENNNKEYVNRLLDALHAAGAKAVVLTGVRLDDTTIGVLTDDGTERQLYCHERLPKDSHGTGDVFSSVFTGMMMNGKSLYESAGRAADFTLHCMKYTSKDPSHWYGVKFEPLLKELAEGCVE